MHIHTNITIGENMTNHIIGIKLADGSFYPILQEGNPEKKTLELTTVHDGQTKVEVHLFKAETESMENAEYVDTLVIENLIPHEKQTPSLSLNIAIDESNNLSAEIADSETGARSDLAVSLLTLAEKVSVPETTFTLSESPLEDDYHNSFTLAEENLPTEEIFSEPVFDTIPDIEEPKEAIPESQDSLEAIHDFAENFETFDIEDIIKEDEQDSTEDILPENDEVSSFDTFFDDTITESQELIESEQPITEAVFSEEDSFALPEDNTVFDEDESFDALPSFEEDEEFPDFISEKTELPENDAAQDFDAVPTSFDSEEITDVFSLDTSPFEQKQEEDSDSFSLDAINFDTLQETEPTEEDDEIFAFIKDEDLPPQEEDFQNPFEIPEPDIIESSASISELDNLPDFADEPFSISSIDIGEVPQEDFSLPQDIYSFNDSDFDSSENVSILPSDNSFEKSSEPLSTMNFSDLYDEERIKGTTMNNESVSKGATVICIICAIISILAVLTIFFFQKKDKVPTDSQVVIEELVEIEQPVDISVPLQELAKEEEIIIIETPIVKPEVVVPVPEEKKEGVTYKIKWGDTLWDLSDTYYQNPWLYKKIAKYNNIQNPNLIISGTYIVIPPK